MMSPPRRSRASSSRSCERRRSPSERPCPSSVSSISTRHSSAMTRQSATPKGRAAPRRLVLARTQPGASLGSMAEVETQLWIGGEQVAGEGEALHVENPATEETLATLGSASDEQVDAAVAAAASAQRGWENTPAAERAEMLHE